MAANKSVTVLTPNGRRPTVKITPNTTILQILEEACQKHNFNPDEYDLKHFNRILDVTTIFRYANIANNACLEMVTCKNPRTVSNVTICVQPENGERKTSEFPPDENIDKLLKNLGLEFSSDTAVIIYTQREIYGKDFATTTLKSLGLTSGKALFRLLQRDPEKLKEQAHVYVPPKPKVPKTEDIEESKPRQSLKNKPVDPISIIKAEKGKPHETENLKKEILEPEKKTEDIVKEISSSSTSEEIVKKEEIIPMEVDHGDEIKSQQDSNVEIEVPQVEFLGERNALLFNQAGAKAMRHDDIPDNFFELTMSDAKALLRDVKRLQTQLEDAPLLTSSLRELESDKDKLTRLHKYKQTIIRIQFPSQLVLQGLFKPLETVQTVYDFVKSYLENAEDDFALYTAPPRCDLNAKESLIDSKLVPSAIIYYSGSSDLKSDVKSKLTDPTAASMQAIKSRLITTRKDCTLMEDFDDLSNPSTSNPTFMTSKSNGIVEPTSTNRPQSQTTTKVPKWFKLSK